MNTNNKRAVITGVITLIAGVAIGVGAADLKAGTPGASRTMGDNTNLMSILSTPLTTQKWDPFQEIQDVQMRMDGMLNQMSAQLRAEPQFSGMAENPGYSLSLNVQDLKNQYRVTAFLPDTKVSDVNVKLANDRTLKVDVSNQLSQTSDKKNQDMSIAEWGQYQQEIDLPSPVKANEMKVTRENHELLITLPKA